MPEYRPPVFQPTPWEPDNPYGPAPSPAPPEDPVDPDPVRFPVFAGGANTRVPQARPIPPSISTSPRGGTPTQLGTAPGQFGGWGDMASNIYSRLGDSGLSDVATGLLGTALLGPGGGLMMRQGASMLGNLLGMGGNQNLSPNDPMFEGHSPWAPGYLNSENYQYGATTPGPLLSPAGTSMTSMGTYYSPGAGFVVGTIDPQSVSSVGPMDPGESTIDKDLRIRR